MKRLTCLLLLSHFISTMLLPLQPTAQAMKLSDLHDIATPRLTVRDVPAHTDTTQGFRVEYTLITANSPDCEPSLVDNFPVKVQYRITSRSSDVLQNNFLNRSAEWMDSPYSPALMPGEKCLGIECMHYWSILN